MFDVMRTLTPDDMRALLALFPLLLVACSLDVRFEWKTRDSAPMWMGLAFGTNMLGLLITVILLFWGGPSIGAEISLGLGILTVLAVVFTIALLFLAVVRRFEFPSGNR